MSASVLSFSRSQTSLWANIVAMVSPSWVNAAAMTVSSSSEQQRESTQAMEEIYVTSSHEFIKITSRIEYAGGADNDSYKGNRIANIYKNSLLKERLLQNDLN